MSAAQRTQPSEGHHSRILDLCPFLLASSCPRASTHSSSQSLNCCKAPVKNLFLCLNLSGNLKNRDFLFGDCRRSAKTRAGQDRAVRARGKELRQSYGKTCERLDGKPASKERAHRQELCL